MIILYLITKSKQLDSKERKNDDPETFEIGDILAGSFCGTMTLPRFFKIIKRTAKQFTCIRLKGKIVSGHKNGQWEEVPTDEPYSDKEYTGRIRKWGGLKIDDVSVRIWDGKPLHGDDQD